MALHTSHSGFSAELSLSLLRERDLCIPFGFFTARGRLLKCNSDVWVLGTAAGREFSKEVLCFCLFCWIFFSLYSPFIDMTHSVCLMFPSRYSLTCKEMSSPCRGEHLYELRDFYFKSLLLVLWVIQMVHPLIVWVIDDDKWVDQRHCKLLTSRQNHYLKTIVLAVFSYQSIWLRNELELQHWEKEISLWHTE